MANKNAFLGVRLDAASMRTLDVAAKALQQDTATLLAMPAGTGFDPVDTEALHMTFLFFGEYLRALPAEGLRQVHACICEKVLDALNRAEPPIARLQFQGFELFPPEKMNLVVARFVATAPLLKLRSEILEVCHSEGICMPSSFFSLIEGEGAWSPHVTLGKIRACRSDVGHASCSGAALQALAPTAPAIPLGLTLLGERPPRAWCDWDAPLIFQPEEEDLEPQPPALNRELSRVYGVGASKYEAAMLQEWEQSASSATEMLNAGRKDQDEFTRGQNLSSAVMHFRRAIELRPDFPRAYIGCSRTLCLQGKSAESRHMILQGLGACPDDIALAKELTRIDGGGGGM